jgi:hypothetical protein
MIFICHKTIKFLSNFKNADINNLRVEFWFNNIAIFKDVTNIWGIQIDLI